MIIDLQKFFLMSTELVRLPFESGEHDAVLADQPQTGTPLLDGLHGVLDLEEAALRAPDRDVGVVLAAEHGDGAAAARGPGCGWRGGALSSNGARRAVALAEFAAAGPWLGSGESGRAAETRARAGPAGSRRNCA